MHFPFIRYEIGDRGCLMEDVPCSCGRHLKRLKEVAGRTSETIRLGDKQISSVFFFGYFKTHEDVDTFQAFIYPDHLKIDVMLNEKGGPGTLKKIKGFMLEKLDYSVPVDVSSVTSFQREKNGKFIPVKIMGKAHD